MIKGLILAAAVASSPKPALPTCEQLGPVITRTLSPQAMIGCNAHGCAFGLRGAVGFKPKILIVTKDSLETIQTEINAASTPGDVKLYLYGQCTDESGVVNLITNFPGGDA